MRPDMISESEVEITTEDCCEEEDDDEEMVTMLEEPEPEPDHEPVRKRRGRIKTAGSLCLCQHRANYSASKLQAGKKNQVLNG